MPDPTLQKYVEATKKAPASKLQAVSQAVDRGTSEDSGLMPEEIFKRNAPYIKPGNHTYNTPLNPQQEAEFQQWVAQNNVKFDPNDPQPDYDMRGFWVALKAGDPIAKQNMETGHFPDLWKTPYDATFSNESQWASPNAPKWVGNKLVAPDGTVLWDEDKKKKQKS